MRNCIFCGSPVIAHKNAKMCHKCFPNIEKKLKMEILEDLIKVIKGEDLLKIRVKYRVKL